jgi:hypothetical protein
MAVDVDEAVNINVNADSYRVLHYLPYTTTIRYDGRLSLFSLVAMIESTTTVSVGAS